MKTVLLIDDDVTGLKARAMLLRAVGYNVLAVETGTAGLELASEADIVVLDYGLPDISGEEMLRRLQDNHMSLPVILLSGMLSVSGAGKANVSQVIVKGEGAQRLLEALTAMDLRT